MQFGIHLLQKDKMKKLIILILLGCLSTIGYAQSPTYINTTININAGSSLIWYGDVTFGPNAIVYVEDGGYAIFYGKIMDVNPSAKFIALPGNSQIGTGFIVFKGNNPLFSDYPKQQILYGGFTASNNQALINIEIDNTDGLALAGHTRVANEIRLTKGNILLNDFDLVLGSGASIKNYTASRHIVTNGKGVLTKEIIGGNQSFVFPVSIAVADYTPAIITNKAADRTFSVQVKNFQESAGVTTSFLDKGINRTWQISSNMTGLATVQLQHNAADNNNGTRTDAPFFDNAMAYVSQQLSLGNWSKRCLGVNGGSPVSIHMSDDVLIPSGVTETAFFTKKTINCIDLSIKKEVDNLLPKIGSLLVFKITASNLGAIKATGIKVKDILPSGYEYVSYAASKGVYNSATGLWLVGELDKASSTLMLGDSFAILNITVKVKAQGNYSNTATIEGNEEDVDLTNNVSTSAPIPGTVQANLGVVKLADKMDPAVGDVVKLTTAINNVGPNDATKVVVADLLPTGYEFVGYTATIGNYDAQTGKWLVGNFNNGDVATLIVNAKVLDKGIYANTATIAGAEHDPVMANNTSSVAPVPNSDKVDLSISKTTVLTGTIKGQLYDYFLVVKNLGDKLATNVITKDKLPQGISYVSSITDYGSVQLNEADGTVVWNIGQLAPFATVGITIKVRAEVADLVLNTATVVSRESDINPVNNISSVEKEILNIHIPNVITPDGDGFNDTFKITGLSLYPENNVSITNRWGNEVYRSTGRSYNNDWGGNGLNEGTYYYLFRLKDRKGNWHSFTGYITLLKN